MAQPDKAINTIPAVPVLKSCVMMPFQSLARTLPVYLIELASAHSGLKQACSAQLSKCRSKKCRWRRRGRNQGRPKCSPPEAEFGRSCARIERRLPGRLHLHAREAAARPDPLGRRPSRLGCCFGCSETDSAGSASDHPEKPALWPQRSRWYPLRIETTQSRRLVRVLRERSTP